MRKIYIIVLVFLSLLLYSCVPLKKIYYLRENKKDTTLYNKVSPVAPIYLIKPGDLLYIKVFTIDEKLSQLFNPITTGLTPGINEQSIVNFNSYMVNDSGKIKIPLIGAIKVDSLTLEQAQDKINSIIKIYVTDADVIVKLMSFKITFLGEFTRPGVYYVYSGKLNILEAVGMVGDFTQFGDKSKLLIVRQEENNKIYKINLTDKMLLFSDAFYLKPNDIIIAEPYKVKRNNIQLSTISLISLYLSSVINVLILINYFN